MESAENINLHAYWSIFRRRWLPAIATFGSVVALTHLYVSSRVPVYSAQGQLIFKQDKTSSLIGLDSEDRKDSEQKDASLVTEARVMGSTAILQKVLDIVKEDQPKLAPQSLGELRQAVEIQDIEGTEILQVNYKSTNPELAALVVNEIMRVYVDNNLSSNRAATVAAGNFITAQLPKVKANVHRAELALRRFKERNRITDLNQKQQIVTSNIERIKTQIDTTETRIADLDSRIKVLRAALGMNAQQAMVMESYNESPTVQGVLVEFQEVQRKLADARSRYQETHPAIVLLKDKEEQIKTVLQAQLGKVWQGQKNRPSQRLQMGKVQESTAEELIKLEAERLGLGTQKNVLLAQQNSYQRQADMLPELEQQQREAHRELEAAQSTYETLLKSLEEIRVIENRTVGNVRIIEAAETPASAINTNKAPAMMAGGLAGILLASAVVYVIEVRDKKIKTVKEARELFEYTLLGTVPEFGKSARTGYSLSQSSEMGRAAIPVIENPCSAISESYRLLQANLRYIFSDEALKVVVVTSSIPREGKSTTCANLAAVMAQLGYRVLIIDADVRRPSQHQIWGVANELGLINIISENIHLGEASIKKVMSNLYVMTAGVSTSNQPVFLDSKNMANLMGQCSSHYDYVIIDTPSLAMAAEASILGKMANGVLLVTRPGLADSINSKYSKEYLDQSGQNILGIVVNGVIPENEPYSYYHNTESYYESNFYNLVSRGRSWLDNLRIFRRF